MFRGNKYGGIKMAIKLLQGLGLMERERILKDIEKKDPNMASMLKHNMVNFEDLKHLTTKMIGEFIREINLVDLALSLKTASPELREHFFKNVSKNTRSDLEDIINKKLVPINKVDEARNRIMEIVRGKVERGELILNPDKNEEYV